MVDDAAQKTGDRHRMKEHGVRHPDGLMAKYVEYKLTS